MEAAVVGCCEVFVREFARKDGRILKISQCEVGDVGCVVWDAAIVLSCYLESSDFLDLSRGCNLLNGRRVIELGSGTGLVGIQAAASGADCILTDLDECMPLLQLNIKNNLENICGKIECQPLVWGSDVTSFLPAPDYIILADCIYYEESLNSLVKTILDLSDSNTVILCCYERRFLGNKPLLEKQFFELLEQFVTEDIPLSSQDPVYSCDEIRIVKMKLKASKVFPNVETF